MAENEATDSRHSNLENPAQNQLTSVDIDATRHGQSAKSANHLVLFCPSDLYSKDCFPCLLRCTSTPPSPPKSNMASRAHGGIDGWRLDQPSYVMSQYLHARWLWAGQMHLCSRRYYFGFAVVLHVICKLFISRHISFHGDDRSAKHQANFVLEGAVYN